MTARADPATRPLDGLLVISLEQAVAAPMASCRLADAGARVIKIERSEGDFARGYDRAGNGGSSYFTWLNRGKESLVLDIKDAADAALLHRLLQGADALLHNPCATTIVTIYKETKSYKWATLSVVMTLGTAFLVTFLTASIARSTGDVGRSAGKRRPAPESTRAMMDTTQRAMVRTRCRVAATSG